MSFFKQRLQGIRGKAFVAMVVIGIIPSIVLGLVASVMNSNMLKNRIIPITENSLTSLSLNITIQTQLYLSLLNECATSSAAAEIAAAEYSSDQEKRTAAESLYALLSETEYNKKISYPFSSILISKNGTIFAHNTFLHGAALQRAEEQIRNAEYYTQLMNSTRSAVWIGVQNNLLIDNIGKQLFFAQNIRIDREPVGILMFCVDLRFYDKLLTNAQISDQSSMYLLTGGNALVVESSDNYYQYESLRETAFKSTENFMEGNSYIRIDTHQHLLVEKSLTFSDTTQKMVLALIVPIANLQKDSRVFTVLTLFIVLLTLITALFIMQFLDRSILQPIIGYSKAIEQVGTGNLEVGIKECGLDEVCRLGQDLNSMLERMQHDFLALQKKEGERRELEIQTLSAQINPHFIKNTLNSIRLSAELSDAPALAEQIRSFTELFDYIFQVGNLTTVRAEISYLENYMKLQNLRYQNKFYFTVDVEDELCDMMIPSMLFQPIVENSIIHGFSGRKGSGTVVMRGYRTERMAVFEFEDDGVGISCTDPLQTTTGIPHGLMNVKRRIQLHFGEDYGLAVAARESRGTIVTIHLPKEVK